MDRIVPSESIMNYFIKNKEDKMQAILPIDQSLLKTYTVTKGSADLSEYDIITGAELPEQVSIGIVDEDAHYCT